MTTFALHPADAAPRQPHYMTLEGFLDADECRAWIAFAEALGFDEAPINTRRGAVRAPEIRNNDRAMIDDPERAAALWERARPHLPAPWRRWNESTAVGFNERLRFYRYGPGQRFAIHRDGLFRRPDRSAFSRMSFLVYLSEAVEGGETELFDLGVVAPRMGMALCFPHGCLHEGRAVTAGVKYVLRTDVMYSREPSPR
ncbi:MAG: 2OG-Fe(II) oxygenase [Nannocystaceae bacterium]